METYERLTWWVKILPALQETQEMQFLSLFWEDPLTEGMTTHSTILAWESHGQRGLPGYSPWGHKKSDTTEHTAHVKGFLDVGSIGK